MKKEHENGVSVFLEINGHSAVPIHRQIYRQIHFCISSKTLRDNDKLPSLRQVSSSCLIAINTVSRAYRALENDGLIYKKRGVGYFVSKPKGQLLKLDKMQQAKVYIEKAIVEGVLMNLSVLQMKMLFNDVLARRN